MSANYSLIKGQNVSPYYQNSINTSNGVGIVSTPIVDINRILNLGGFFNPISADSIVTTNDRLGSVYSIDNSVTWNNFVETTTFSQCGVYNQTFIDNVCDSTGLFHYFVKGHGGNSNLDHYTTNGITWSQVASYTIPSTNFIFKIQMGLLDTIHILIADYSSVGGTTQIKYALITNNVIGSFTTITQLSPSATIDLFVDSSGVAHMVAGEDNESGATVVTYAKSSNSWTNETAIGAGTTSGSAGTFDPRLVVDSFGYVHVLAILSGFGSYSYWGTYYAYRDSTWHASSLHGRNNSDTGGPAWQMPSISKDVSDNIYISFMQISAFGGIDAGLWFKKRDANLGSWGADTSVATGSVSFGSITNLNFFNPSSFPLNISPNGYGVATLGCRGIFHSIGTGDSPATGYYIWATSDLIPPVIPSEITPINCGRVGIAVNQIPSLSHLEGQTVKILANGIVLDEQIVTNGLVTLPATYSTVMVGLPYTCQLEPVNVEAGLPDGTLQGRQVNITKTVLKVWNTSGGKCGPDFDHLQDIKDLQRSVLINANGVPIYTGDVKLVRGGGYQGSGSICIQQDDPLPITITAMVFEVQPGGMNNLTS